MGRKPKQTFLQRKYTDGQQIHKKMLNIAHYYRNANQNYHLTPVRYHLTLVRYHVTLVRMAIIKKSTNKCWRGCGEKGPLLHCWWECKLIQPLWKMVWRFLKELGIKPPYDPATPLLGIYPEEIKTENDSCTPVFTEALFTVARTWKQPRCPSTDEWIKS